MIKISIKILLLIGFLFFPLNEFAQGSGSSKDSKSSKKSNFAINRSTSGTVASISASSISIRTSAGKTTLLMIKRNTKFIGGRPSKGDKVRVIYLANNKQAVLIRRG